MKANFKMKCEFVTDLGDRQTVSFVACDPQETKSLWDKTPNGRLDLGNISQNHKFKPAKEYYIEIEDA